MTEITAAEIAETQQIIQGFKAVFAEIGEGTPPTASDFQELVTRLQTLHTGRTGDQLRAHAEHLRDTDPIGDASWSGPSKQALQADALDKAASTLDLAKEYESNS